MTDLATRPGADETMVDGEAKPVVDAPKPLDDGTDAPPPAYEWASAEPAPRRRRLWLWIAIPVAVVAVGLGITSLVLIAPGTAVAGVPVGGLTPGAAVEAVQQRLANTTIVLTGSGADATISGADLGATVDARALVDEAFAAHPAWNVGAWFAAPMHAQVAVDTATAVSALRAAVPSLYVDPTDATVAYDPASTTYVATPAIDGAGVDVDAVRVALQDAFVAGDLTVDLATTTAAVDPEIPTYVANATVGTLNKMLDTAGFYVGTERTVPIDRATLASWLTVTRTAGNTFEIAADAKPIQPVVDALPASVDRAAVAATVIANEGGRVLRTPTAGVSGRALETTSGIAAGFASQLATGNAVYELPVQEVAFNTTTIVRLLEVNLSEQRLYLKENGAVVDSWLISSGLSFATVPGHYTINSHYPVQTMKGFNLDGTPYTTENVQWVMYFNGGQAFHGVYWHTNWGHRMSHGCVGMPISRAQADLRLVCQRHRRVDPQLT